MDNQRYHSQSGQAGLKIFIGADHRGYALKSKVAKFLTARGYDVVDVGTHEKGVSCDYPEFSFKVAQSVVQNPGARGILVCMTGIGHSIAANKVPGVRAALCYNTLAARLARSHNDANVLIVGSKFVSQKEIWEIVKTWLKTKFEGGRHLRRVKQIHEIERKFMNAKGEGRE